MKTTPANALMHHVQTRPDATAFIFHEDVWSDGRLAAEADRLARGLAARGVGPGDRVVLHMVNRPEMLVAYFACLRLGAIAAPLRTAFKFAELAPMLQRLAPALYIGESDLYRNVAAVDPDILPQEKRFIVDALAESDGTRSWEELQQSEPVELPVPPSYEPAVLINTSGTTGQPKFVAHTPDTLAATSELLSKYAGISSDDVIVAPLPLGHISGLFCALTSVQRGVPFVMQKSFDADAVLDAIERHRCTWMIGLPFQYAALLETQQTRPRDLSSLRICLTGADVCPTDLQERVMEAFGAPLYNFWG